MSRSEEPLSELLHRVVPPPPQHLSVAQIEYLARQRATRSAQRRHRGWVIPALAAGVVLAIVGTVAIRGRNSSAGPGESQLPSPAAATDTMAASTPPTTTRPSIPATAPAWSVAALGTQHGDYLVGGGQRLYTVSTRDVLAGTSIVGVDPATGATQAHTNIGGVQNADMPGRGLPVLAAGSLWVLSGQSGAGVVRLWRLDAQTLRVQGSVPIAFSATIAADRGGAIAAVPAAGELYVGGGDSLVTVSTATMTVERREQIVGGQVDGLAVTSDGSLLYVGITSSDSFATGGTGSSFLQKRQASSGTLISSVGGPPVIDGSSGLGLGRITGLVATSGGVWVASEFGGNGEVVDFVSSAFDGREPGHPAEGIGGGGTTALASVARSTIWLGGGPRGVSCVDPRSGTARAIRTTGEAAQISTVAVASGRLFGVVQPSDAVVQVVTPTVC
jgi:hypothetical protein